MKCDIIIPIWNNLELTRDCLESLIKNTAYPYRLILVDNASSDGAGEYLKGLKKRAGLDVELILNEENLGFVRAVNQALEISSSPYVCVMNNDTVPAPGWLGRMVDFALTHPDVGLINPQCSGHGDMPIDDYAALLKKNKGVYMEMNQCQGFCMLVKRALIDRIGHLDEAFGIGGFDDTDYSMRAHLAGYRSVAIGDSYVYHRLHGTFDKAGTRAEWVRRNRKIYYDKWGKHLRVALAVSLDSHIDASGMISNTLLFAHGMAREWSWVHIWLNSPLGRDVMKKGVEAAGRKNGLPPHQNLKIACFGLPAALFNAVILGKFLERLRPRMRDKRFDGLVAASDDSVINLLKPFSKALGARLAGISFNEDGCDWYRRGRDMALEIKREVRSWQKRAAA